jgi:hypothetical protein
VKLADLGHADPMGAIDPLSLAGRDEVMDKSYMSVEQRFGWNLTEKSDICEWCCVVMTVIDDG